MIVVYMYTKRLNKCMYKSRRLLSDSCIHTKSTYYPMTVVAYDICTKAEGYRMTVVDNYESQKMLNSKAKLKIIE